MKEIISEVLGVFAKEFPLHYKDALIEHCKEEAQPQEEDERKLPDAPIPDYELKTGSLTKRGDMVKNWKQRHFVALNEADNFRIDYYEKEGGKLKGTINCCGYSAEEYNEEEAKEMGQFGIKIVPSDTKRRTWFLKCENEEEKAEWMKIFSNACSKAGPPVNPDPLISAGFRGAYRAVRWAYGYYGWYRVSYSEAEQLGELVSAILARELVNAVFDGIAAGPQRYTIIKMVQNIVDTSVIAAVSAAWNASVQACQGLKSSLESAVKSLLSPIFEQEVAIKEKISTTCSNTVNPFLEDVGGRICRPVLKACAAPITRAYVASVQGFATYMRNQITSRSFESADQLDMNVRSVHRSVEYWWSGPLEDTNRICWSLYTSDLTDVAAFFSGGFTSYSLYSNVLDAIRNLTHRAIHAFHSEVKEAGVGSVDRILNSVLGRFIHDAKLSLQLILNNILKGLLQSPIETVVFTPCLELVKPIQEVIDSIPVPGLSDLFNLSTLMEEVLNNVLDSGVSALVKGAYADVASQIDAAGAGLGVQSA
jgi:hypothetical protein